MSIILIIQTARCFIINSHLHAFSVKMVNLYPASLSEGHDLDYLIVLNRVFLAS